MLIRLRREVKIILGVLSFVLVLLLIIGFTDLRNASKPVNDVIVNIQDQDGSYFTDQQEVMSLMNASSTDYVLGSTVGSLDLKELELRVEANPFVKDAQIYRDLKGNLIVNITQAKPIARIVKRQGRDFYIDEDGRLLPAHAKQTARVPIIELERAFSWEANLTETEYGTKILDLLRYINEDPFWHAQIAEIVIERDGELVLLPQVTKQEVKFGMPEDVETKFKKLRVFYTQILPNKGWNTYSMVNLKFKDQIVCE